MLTSRVTEITGNILEWAGGPVGAEVIAFADDPSRWVAGSRFVTRTGIDPKGGFKLQGMPPGNYLIVAVDSLGEEWHKPGFLGKLRARSTPLRLEEGEAKTIVVPLTPSG